MKWTFPKEYHHPKTRIEAKHRRATKHIAHRNERYQPIELDGIVPTNIIVKGEVNVVAPAKRDRATRIEVAPNVFDIVYVTS